MFGVHKGERRSVQLTIWRSGPCLLLALHFLRLVLGLAERRQACPPSIIANPV